jgi:hypothetical protein
MIRRSLWALGVAAIMLSQAGSAYAAVVIDAPEISPSSLSAGLALVAGGVLLARARWRK